MKVKAEVVAAQISKTQVWTGSCILTLTLCAVGDHDQRTFEIDVPSYLERSFPVGRRVAITIQPLR